MREDRAEEIVYDHTLTKQERRRVERHLRRKWFTRRERVWSLIAARTVTRRSRRQSNLIRAVDEDVREAFMHLEEVILSLPGRWNDPLVPDECADALQAAYKSLNDLRRAP